MITTIKKHAGGRPKMISDIQKRERNLAIWRQHFYEKLGVPELIEKHNLGQAQIYNCLRFVEKEIGVVPEKTLLAGSISAIGMRIKDLMKLREREIARPKKSIRNIIEIEREVRADEDVMLRLSGLLKNVVELEVQERPHSTKAILESIVRADEGNVPQDKKVDFIMADLKSQEDKR